MGRFLLFLIAGFILTGSASASNDSYPGRTVYPKVEIYQTGKLNQSYNDVIIVDVRSKFEYETLHINSAVNIPLNSRDFVKQVSALVAQAKPIIFYCNGHRCYHSYKAVMKARKAGIKNIFSYDSGIFDWAKAHPDKATLLGTTPLDPKLLISKSNLKKHMLSPIEFASKAASNAVILDIREPVQRGLLELFPYRQENISLSQKGKLVQFLEGLKEANKTLLVYDEGGTQVRWLQYYLKDEGVSDYYFMQGGVKKYFKSVIN